MKRQVDPNRCTDAIGAKRRDVPVRPLPFTRIRAAPSRLCLGASL
ncbi:hypothetical protein [Aeromicrobium sp. P5_D10]